MPGDVWFVGLGDRWRGPDNQAISSSITATPKSCTTTLSIHYWIRKLLFLIPCPSPSSRELNPWREIDWMTLRGAWSLSLSFIPAHQRMTNPWLGRGMDVGVELGQGLRLPWGVLSGWTWFGWGWETLSPTVRASGMGDGWSTVARRDGGDATGSGHVHRRGRGVGGWGLGLPSHRSMGLLGDGWESSWA